VLSSKSDAKAEGRFAARLDVLTERVDMLATTIATTASAIAKKDGEIAALQRAFEERDQTLRALVEHANRAAQAPPADAPIDESELRSLKNAVAALTKERAGGVNAAQIERLVATVRALAERVDALAAVVATPSEPTPDLALTARVDAVAAELAAVKTALEPRTEELVAMLAVLHERVDGLTAVSVTEKQLDERLAETRTALEALPHRIDELSARVDSGSESLADRVQELHVVQREVAETTAAVGSVAQRIDRLDSMVESGTASLTDKEQRLGALERQFADSRARIESIADDFASAPAETRTALDALAHRIDELSSGLESATTSHTDEEQRLEALHRQVSESSSRIESIADDLREALGAFPEATPDQVGELNTRIDMVEQRVATVAVEVARAKTLWPVALRSLEARLDDVAPKSAHDEPRAETNEVVPERDEPGETTDDLLAGLRDSLQAMESVAAELERTAEVTPEDTAEEQPQSQQAVAGGARVVPLRTPDP
jgi:chromosome segregation ATPase